MKSPLDKTFLHLASSPNFAAAQIVFAALRSEYLDIRQKAFAAALKMNNAALLRGAFLQFAGDVDSLEQLAASNPRDLERLASKIVTAQDTSLGVQACEVIESHRLYGTLPALITRFRSHDDPLLPVAAKTVLGLANSFHNELAEAEDVFARRDLDRQRDWIATQLEQPVRNFDAHEREEPVEAFLVVARRENDTLLSILEDNHSHCHDTMVSILGSSASGGVIRLLLSFVSYRETPTAVSHVISSRTDVRFVRNLLELIGETPSLDTIQDLSRLEPADWCVPGHALFTQLPASLQANALEFLRYTCRDRAQVLAMIKFLFESGSQHGRRAAARFLNKCTGKEADQLVIEGLKDEDPLVRATLVREIRARDIAESMSLLMRMADEKNDLQVREAIQESLPEFQLGPFLRKFEQLPEQTIERLGRIVRKVDIRVRDKLREEMNSISPLNRRRAVLASLAMELTEDLEAPIVNLVEDEDHRVRIAACEALGSVHTRLSFNALRAALNDRSPVVRRSAQASLALLCKRLSSADTVAIAPNR